jgi:hypothetical protein
VLSSYLQSARQLEVLAAFGAAGLTTPSNDDSSAPTSTLKLEEAMAIAQHHDAASVRIPPSYSSPSVPTDKLGCQADRALSATVSNTMRPKEIMNRTVVSIIPPTTYICSDTQCTINDDWATHRSYAVDRYVRFGKRAIKRLSFQRDIDV